MKKKIMLLGGLNYLLPVIEIAHKHNYYVITVDYLPDNIAHKYSDEYHNVSIIDKEAVLALAFQLKIDGIMSFAVDPGVITAAYVAEKMGLPFQCSYETACILQDKSKFRKFLAENNFNVPNAKGYNNVETALEDTDYFNWPVIVKPVDSAGSKGVSRVDEPKDLKKAIDVALSNSLSNHFIIEDFLELEGFQSSADCFSVGSSLQFITYSDQVFDKESSNPYVPIGEIWPSSMPKRIQGTLSSELQRLFDLLNLNTGIYNIETRLCKNGKAYIMEVSPRGGGDRIAEIQELATGVKLIEAEVLKAVGDEVPIITPPEYTAYYCIYTLYSSKSGILKEISFDKEFAKNHLLYKDIAVEKGDIVTAMSGANTTFGTLFLKFDKYKELFSIFADNNWCKIVVE